MSTRNEVTRLQTISANKSFLIEDLQTEIQLLKLEHAVELLKADQEIKALQRTISELTETLAFFTKKPSTNSLGPENIFSYGPKLSSYEPRTNPTSIFEPCNPNPCNPYPQEP